VYFNESVIPDRSRTETSGDGGIIWTEVPAGTYRGIATSPSTRFASFLATCEPGRIVNANPPWGAYELTGKEKPLGAGIVAASLESVHNRSSRGDRTVVAKIATGELVKAKLTLGQRGNTISRLVTNLQAGRENVALTVPARNEGGSAKLTVELRDEAGDSVTEKAKLKLPEK
jgi:hypothetical protein